MREENWPVALGPAGAARDVSSLLRKRVRALKVIDITGPIYPGMWSYGPPYPPVEVELLPSPEWVPYRTYSWRLQITAQTGTYLENARHMSLDEPPLESIDVSQLILRPAILLRVPKAAGERIELEEIERAAADKEIPSGVALLIATGWGQRWEDDDFVSASPYFSRDAMLWLLDRQPFLIGADLPRFDNLDDPQLFFPEFFRRGVLLMAPLVNLEKIPVDEGRITVLPIRIRDVAAAPCRAVFCWEDE